MDNVYGVLDLGEVEQDMRLCYVLWLFKNAKVILSKAAQLVAIDVYAFIAECKKK